jgi:hypothetical protein
VKAVKVTKHRETPTIPQAKSEKDASGILFNKSSMYVGVPTAEEFKITSDELLSQFEPLTTQCRADNDILNLKSVVSSSTGPDINTHTISTFFHYALCDNIPYGNLDAECIQKRKIAPYCLKLWLEFYNKIAGPEIPSDVIDAIKMYSRLQSVKRNVNHIILNPNSIPKADMFKDLYDMYKVISKFKTGNSSTNIEELAYNTVRTEYMYVPCDSAVTTKDETVVALVKQWINVYVTDYYLIDKNSLEIGLTIQSSVLLDNILKFIAHSPLKNWVNHATEHVLTSKFLAQVLAEMNIPSTRKSAGIFYDLSSISATKSTNTDISGFDPESLGKSFKY